MKLTWSFYRRFEPSVTLTVYYLPEIDKKGTFGFLHEDSNTAWVSWQAWKIFESLDNKAKKEAFGRLIRIESEENIQRLLQ